VDIRNLGFYQKKFLKILTKEGKLARFLPNVYQEELNKLIDEKRRHQEPVRLRVLKCRQIGISTWGSSLNYHFTTTYKNKNALIIAHDQESSSGLFEMSKKYWEHTPEMYRPMRRRSNAKELIFDNPETDSKTRGLGSMIKIETANNLSAGRSKTIQCLHQSEKAFWRDAATVQTGLYQSIPYKPDTVILDESTANGVTGKGEQFYNDWHDSNFTNVFFKWTHNPEYEIPVTSDFKPDHYEKELMKLHPELTLPKLNFRRYKLKNEMGSALLDPETQFSQEYPLTEQEAFISSGRPVFNMAQVLRDIESIKTLKHEVGEI